MTDADGVILSMPPVMMAQHHYSFPVINGIDAKDSLASRQTRMAVYQRFVAELDQNHQHLTEQVSEIDLSDPEDLRAVMPEQGSDILAHFGEGHFLERWQTYKAHIGEWKSRYPKLIGVDLRYSGEIPLEMASDAAGSTSAASAPLRPIAVSKPSAANKPVEAVHKATSVKPASAKTSSAKPATAKAATARILKEKKANAAAHRAAEARRKAARQRAAHEKAVHAASGRPAQ